MQTRSSSFTVNFSAPFKVSGIETAQPPGAYLVDKDEEIIEGLSWLAYRRTGTFIHLPATAQNQGSQLVSIDPAELEALMEKDREHARMPDRHP